MSENTTGRDIPLNKPPIDVDTEFIFRLTHPSEAEINVFSGDSFYRYPEEFNRLEDHMRRHIEGGNGDYFVLCVGASTGKEPLSVVLSWEEMVRTINPQYDGTVGVLAVERNLEAIAAFQQNNFPVFGSRDNQLERVMRYVSARTPLSEGIQSPAFIKPEAFVSFPEGIIKRITYLQIDAESPQVSELHKVFRADSFNAAICHTTSRYFSNEVTSMQRIRGTLGNGGFLSHVR
jgi:hypothetical protein